MTHFRLFIGDHAESLVRAIEVEDGTSAGIFEIEQTPALTSSASGQTVFAVQGNAGKVAVIQTGISFEDHGNHADIHVKDAVLLPLVIEGGRPAHVVDGSGSIAIFDDGTGDVTSFAESEVLEGAFQPRKLNAGAAHHGLAAPMGDFLVVSVAGATSDDPRVGLKVLDPDGSQVGDVIAYPGVHGQAQSACVFAFGCRDGVVIATPGKGSQPPVLEHSSTASLGEGSVSTLKGGTAMHFFLGNYGPSAVVIIEPGTEEMFRKIDLPTRRIDFALDPAKASNAYVLTVDRHWRDPRPRLAVAGEYVAVTDPLQGLVRLETTSTLEEERAIEVDGTPYTIIAVGGSGALH